MWFAQNTGTRYCNRVRGVFPAGLMHCSGHFEATHRQERRRVAVPGVNRERENAQ